MFFSSAFWILAAAAAGFALLDEADFDAVDDGAIVRLLLLPASVVIFVCFSSTTSMFSSS